MRLQYIFRRLLAIIVIKKYLEYLDSHSPSWLWLYTFSEMLGFMCTDSRALEPCPASTNFMLDTGKITEEQ